MATSTLNQIGSAVARTGGSFRRGLQRLMTARELQARRYVNDYMLAADDASPAAFGIDRKSLLQGIDGRFPW